jgi:hypothetical protein
VVRALRYQDDEVQLGRVLAVLCRNPRVASHFSRLVISHAEGGSRSARARAARVPEEVHCLDEQAVHARVTRVVGRSTAKKVGRVDLAFTSTGGWRLLVELKLRSGFGKQQLERYASVEAPVVAIVRSRSTIPTTLKDNPNWAGAAEWQDLAEGLGELPVDDEDRAVWLALLAAMAEDGELSPEAAGRSKDAERALALVQEAAPVALDRFRAALAKKHRDAAELAISRLRLSKPRYAGHGAGFGFHSPGDGPWLWVSVRDVTTRTPRLSVEYYRYNDWWALRKLADAHTRIERRHQFESLPLYHRYERLRPDLASLDGPKLGAAIGEKLDQLVRSGVFEVEIRRQAKKASVGRARRPVG